MLSTYHILRALHTTLPRLLPRTSRRGNPGVGAMTRALDDDVLEEELRHNDPEGYFAELESDFMDVHRTHRQHEREQLQQREHIRRRMVAKKYFRELPLPNMLTYGEKEQMRLLNARAPEEWTPERLAESFPASPEVVAKILAAKWRPSSAKRIREHDEAVMRRWEQFRGGNNSGGGGDSEELQQLPPALREHLQKFATRQREDLQTPAEAWPIHTELPKPRRQEFLSLITSCSKYAEEKTQTNAVPQLKVGAGVAAAPPVASGDPAAETYLLDKVHDKRKMRLQELKQFKLSPAELAASAAAASASAASVTPEQKLLYSGDSPGGTGIVPNVAPNPFGSGGGGSVTNYAQKFESSEIVISEEDRRSFEMTRVKDRIHIPRRVWRRGATFRVEDCYYDDDGELLYRVPGMTGAQ